MVRVPKLPLSIAAVDSYTPSSISTTDMGVRMASLVLCSAVSRRHSVMNHRPGCGYGHRSKLSASAPQKEREPGSHYRRPCDQAGPDMTHAGTAFTEWRRRTRSFEPKRLANGSILPCSRYAAEIFGHVLRPLVGVSDAGQAGRSGSGNAPRRPARRT